MWLSGTPAAPGATSLGKILVAMKPSQGFSFQTQPRYRETLGIDCADVGLASPQANHPRTTFLRFCATPFDQKSEVSEEDSAQRERHLKNMRDRIVSAKRAGREEEASKAASESAAAAERGERATLPRTGGMSTSAPANKHSSPASGASTQGAP